MKAEAEGGAGLSGVYDEEEGGYMRPEAMDQSRIEDLIRQHLGPNALEVCLRRHHRASVVVGGGW